MKKQVILQLIIWSSLFYAQPDSVLNSLDYYPMHIGDYWQYQVEKRGVFPSDSASWIGYKEVVGDTIMDNGKKYFIVRENIIPTFYSSMYYKRIDSSSSVIYNYTLNAGEEKVDSLLAKKGDEIYSGFNCVAESSKVILEQSVETKFFEDVLISINSYDGYEYAKGLGETMRYFEDISVYTIRYEAKLIYAKIGSEEFGIRTSIENKSFIPENFYLSQNYPNPFNPSTKIEFNLPKPYNLKILLYNSLGEQIKVINENHYPIGKHEIIFTANNLPSGIYYYALKTQDHFESKKMVLLK